MAATTISRATLTDGVTVWNAAQVGTAVYDKIDALIAATITFGGTVSAQGFGTHLFSAGGTGANSLQVRNPTAGTGNYGNLLVQADNGSAYLSSSMFSSTWTSTVPFVANGASVECTGAGGLSLIASNASTGDLRLFAGGNSAITLKLQASPFFARIACGVAFETYYDQTITGTQALGSSFAAAYAVHFRCTGSSTPRISGARSGNYHGELIVISNVAATAIVVEHNTAGMGNVEILLANSTNLTLDQNDSVTLFYDSQSSAWRAIGQSN